MLKTLTDAEKDYAFSQGVLEQWLNNAPKQIKEHLTTLTAGISAYREKYTSIQEDYDRLLAQYNQLVGTSAQYLEVMRQQKEQIDQVLIEQQREYHQKHPSDYIKKDIIEV